MIGKFVMTMIFFRNCLLRTLTKCCRILEFVKNRGVEVKFHGRGKNEASHYCGQCEVSTYFIKVRFPYPVNFNPDYKYFYDLYDSKIKRFFFS